MAAGNTKKWYSLDTSQRIAFISLVLALLSFFYAIYLYIQGADISLFTPSMVEFRPYDGGTFKAKELRALSAEDFAATKLMMKGTTLDYRNAGGAQYGGMVRYERAILTVQTPTGAIKKVVELDWHYFNNFGTQAAPVVVPGNSVLSHETWFFPRLRCDFDDTTCGGKARANFLPWPEFRQLLLATPTPILHVEFVSTVLEDRQVEKRVQCRVALDAKVLAALREDERLPYIASPCCSEENADLVCRSSVHLTR